MRILYSALLLVSLALCAKCGAEKAWSEGRYPYENASTEIPFKKESDHFSSTGKLKVNIRNSYPLFQNATAHKVEVNAAFHNTNMAEDGVSGIQKMFTPQLYEQLLQNDSLFIQEVNRHLHNNAKETVCSFIQQFAEEELKGEEFDEEAISMDFDKREISYVF